MSIIVILLLPLVADGACLPSRKRDWAAGVTVVSCLTILVLAARVAWHGLGGQFRHGGVESREYSNGLPWTG